MEPSPELNLMEYLSGWVPSIMDSSCSFADRSHAKRVFLLYLERNIMHMVYPHPEFENIMPPSQWEAILDDPSNWEDRPEEEHTYFFLLTEKGKRKWLEEDGPEFFRISWGSG